MSQVTTQTVEISSSVALSEAHQQIEYFRSRNLVLAQALFDQTQFNDELTQKLAGLETKLEAFLAEANGGGEEPVIVEPEGQEA